MYSHCAAMARCRRAGYSLTRLLALGFLFLHRAAAAKLQTQPVVTTMRLGGMAMVK